MFEIGQLTRLPLGYVGENGTRTISIDMKAWLDEYPGALIMIQVIRPVDHYKYPAAYTKTDGVLHWTVDGSEVMYAGKGLAQIALYNPDTKQEYKSRVVGTIVAESIDEFNEIILDENDPAQKWVNQVLTAAGKVDESRDAAMAAAYRAESAVKRETEKLAEQIDTLNQGGLLMKEDFIGEQVNDWLNEHPEATTTVQDGSISLKKLTDDARMQMQNTRLTPQMYGAVGDGVTDDTVALTAYARDCDTQRYSEMYLPTQYNNYLVSSPITFHEPGVKLCGDKGASYNRGMGKLGNIIIGADATHAIDLGDGRTASTSNNPADCWTVENIGIVQEEGTAFGTKNGIVISAMQNGPDRGILFNEVSATGLEAAVYIPQTASGVSIQAANLNITNCAISENKVALLNDGSVYGMRFVGNQCEQNAEHAIKGKFAGGVVISDNMLEGQKNPICMPSCFAQLNLVSERNYFERNEINDSEYIYYLGNTEYYITNRATIKNNFTSGNEKPPDYIRLTGKGNWVIDTDEEVTLHQCDASIVYGSKIFAHNRASYSVRRLGLPFSTMIYVDGGLNKLDVDNTHTHITFDETSGTQKMTPFGLKYCANGLEKISVPVGINKGDLVVMNVLMRAAKNSLTNLIGKTGTLYSPYDGYVNNGYPNGIMECSCGEWSLVSIPFICTGILTEGFKFQLGVKEQDEVLDICGIAIKNYGQFANDGTTKIDITPVCPIV